MSESLDMEFENADTFVDRLVQQGIRVIQLIRPTPQ